MGRGLKITLILLEAVGLVVIVALFSHRLTAEKERAVDDYRNVVRQIATQCRHYYAQDGTDRKNGGPSPQSLYLFLKERLGRDMLTDLLEPSPQSFSVNLEKDLKRSGPSARALEALYSGSDYVVQEHDGQITVSSPFTLPEDREPSGLVSVTLKKSDLYRAVISENMALCLALLLLFNTQAILAYFLATRPRQVTEIHFKKGYLKEHALGALKLQHKILGDIISDHEEDDEAAGEEFFEEEEDLPPAKKAGKVIRFPGDRKNEV